MGSDNSSWFGVDSVDFSNESAETQFISENICGEGAFCTVYRVRLDGLQVAVKRLSDTERLNATFIAAYRKEFEIGRRLKHDALPVYRDLRVDTKEVYIVMDYVDGITVSDFLDSVEGQEYFNDGDNLKRFILQLLDVVAYLHRCGVIHCDLKPANIMLRNSDRALMLIDFDKAYCDTHDLTHGGTPGVSTLLHGTVKPSSAKDFSAIGKVLDIIQNRSGQFACRKFRRFRDLCDTPDISEAKLRRALLTSHKRAKMAVLAIIALVNIFFVVAILFLIRKESEPVINQYHSNENIAQYDVPDTSGGIVSSGELLTKPEIIASLHQQVATEKIEITDIDARMAEYIKEAQSAIAALRSGKLADSDIQVLASRVSDLYSSGFDEIIADYKRQFPNASESDVYLKAMTALGNSRTFEIMQSFNKELLDTVNVRLGRVGE